MIIKSEVVWLLGLGLVALCGVGACRAPSSGPVEAEAAAAATATSEPTSVGIDLESAQLVDLSYAYDEETLYWPTSPSHFELEELANGISEGGYYYSAYVLGTPEHGGTHIDAPIHFAENAATTAEIPLEQLIGPGVVIDVSEQAAADVDYRLDLATVTAWEARNGPVPRGAIVILRTGWASRWPDAMRYLGDDTPGDASNLHFPGYGEEAARHLVEERGVASLGIDTASIDYGPSTDFIAHRIAAAAGVFNLENLTNVSGLPETGFHVLALPMKIGKGSGGPVRVVAVLP